MELELFKQLVAWLIMVAIDSWLAIAASLLLGSFVWYCFKRSRERATG